MQSYRRTITAEQIKELVGRPDPLILEIGCHNGSDTIKFLYAMPQASVHCFECDKRAIEQFEAREFPEGAKVELWRFAVSNEDEHQDFHASTGKAGRLSDWDLSGSLCKPTGHLTRSPEIGFKPPTRVACMRLDTWYNIATMYLPVGIDFIWADVQGSQRKVIAGGNRALAATRWLYMEAHDPVAYAGEPTQEELIDELSGIFDPVAIYARENILFKNRLL